MKYLKHKICLLTAAAFLTGILKSNAQVRTNLNLSNDGAPASTAFLDASSSVLWNDNSNNLGKGLVFPRTDLTKLSSFMMNGTVLPINYPTRMDGMLVYNTATGTSAISFTPVVPGFYYYKNSSNTLLGGSWVAISGNGSTGMSGWRLTGNAGNSAANFLGTTDLKPLAFKVNGITAATFNTNGSDPSHLDLKAPLFMNGESVLWDGGLPSQFNLMVGNNKARNLTGQNNTFVGADAGVNVNTASFNTLVGAASGRENTTGISNTFIGAGAGLLNATGNSNVALGGNAGPVGTFNNTIALGYGATVKADNSMALGGINAYRVNVGINTEKPRAALDINTDDAIILPVGPTTKQPVKAVAGMIRFNNETNFLEYRNNTTWVSVGFGPGWSLNGNSGTSPLNNSVGNYIGTADNQPTVFSANAIEAFRILPNGTNPGNVDLKAPLFVNGQRMLWDGGTPGKNNMIIGNTIPSGITGINNLLMGRNAGATLTSGDENIFIGDGAGIANMTGSRNTAIGSQAGPSVAGLNNTVALGYKAKVDISNAVVIGSETNPVSVGINIASPRAAFDIFDKGAMILPRGSEAQRPTQAKSVAGMVRYNGDSFMMEYYNGTEWISLTDYRSIVKATFNSGILMVAPAATQIVNVPVPGAKVGGVVEVSLSAGYSPYIINLANAVTSDGIVTVSFYSIPSAGNTTPQNVVQGAGAFQIFVSVIQ